MLTSFPYSILNSRIFKFIVGEDVDSKPSEFSVHEGAVAQLSDPLYNLTKGNCAEAQVGQTKWKNVSKNTFERFIQFAYTGDYTLPTPNRRRNLEANEKSAFRSAPAFPDIQNGARENIGSPISDHTLVSDTNEKVVTIVDPTLFEKIDDDSGSILNYPSTPTKKNKKKKRRQTVTEEAKQEVIPETAVPTTVEPTVLNHIDELNIEKTEVPSPPEVEHIAEPVPEPKPVEQPRSSETHVLVADLQAMQYPLLAPRDNYEGTCDPQTDFNKENDYSNVLLCHASLYALADAQLVRTLRALALYKLHKTLCVFELNNENIGDITDLARYAYSTEDKGRKDGIGELRELVCQYLALHALELSGDARFMNLLAGGGEIVKDFFMFHIQKQ